MKSIGFICLCLVFTAVAGSPHGSRHNNHSDGNSHHQDSRSHSNQDLRRSNVLNQETTLLQEINPQLFQTPDGRIFALRTPAYANQELFQTPDGRIFTVAQSTATQPKISISSLFQHEADKVEESDDDEEVIVVENDYDIPEDNSRNTNVQAPTTSYGASQIASPSLFPTVQATRFITVPVVARKNRIRNIASNSPGLLRVPLRYSLADVASSGYYSSTNTGIAYNY